MKFVAIAIGLVGYIVGSNLVGALAHRRRRRLAFLASLLVSGLGSFGTALRPGSFRCRSAFRDRYGRWGGPQPGDDICGGALSFLATRPYLCEDVHDRHHGPGRHAVRGPCPGTELPYRLATSVRRRRVIGLAGVVFAMRLAESPRWLIQNGRLTRPGSGRVDGAAVRPGGLACGTGVRGAALQSDDGAAPTGDDEAPSEQHGRVAARTVWTRGAGPDYHVVPVVHR